MIVSTNILFNDNWQFSKNTKYNRQNVTLPHDWLIYDTHNLYETSVGWYKKNIKADFLTEGARVFLNFDGVYMDTALYVNGNMTGEWKCGYTAFEFDITDFLDKDGENELLVRVDHKSPNSRWYSGAGIYRDVHLKIKHAAHFITDGIYITPRKADESRWEVTVAAEVSAFAKARGADIEIRHTIFDKSGSYGNATGEYATITVDDPKLWDVDSPNLYTLASHLYLNGVIADMHITHFGFREIDFTPNDGFFLNGRRVKLNGVCQHHDLGCLGAAFNKDAARRQLLMLKQMGVNAVRTSHNPPAAAFMELTDEMGFLVLSEFTDMWQLSKTEYDYARFFDEWADRDVASWIKRDRNCPSVIMWSIGNEIYDTHADFDKARAVIERLTSAVLKHDPDVHARVTLCSNYMPWENTQKCADIIKLIGYNYAEYLYNEHHLAHPDWIIYGGETGSTTQSRGVYKFPLAKSVLSDDDMQCSALGNSSTSWGAKDVEAFLTDDRDAEFSLGQFVWTGTDYIGEPTPYHTKNSYFGHIDTAGFPKDSFYVIKSMWTNHKDAPFVHIFPYWDFSPRQIIDVRVCSNAPTVELFLNEKTLGKFDIDRERGKNILGNWSVPYEPGELKAVAYNESGDIIAETVRRSFGDTQRLETKTEIIGKTAFCEISAYDANGNPVENANNRVRIAITGGELLGLDNGNSADFEQYKTKDKRLFNGKLLAVSRVINENEFAVKAELDNSDIPVRKIELTAEGYNIKAKVFPENAKPALEWRLANEAGIDSPLGTLAVSDGGLEAALTPKGDGKVYIRCAAYNGKSHPDFITHLTVDITGVGTLFLNPYAFISGGLYNLSNVELANGNERGVATLRDGESQVGFTGLDFGKRGSDEMILPLFSLSKEPFNFEIWEGMPLDGGVMLKEFTYGLGSIWNTYQEMLVKLPKRLCGVTTLCLVFRQKVHIKGFHFISQKAYDKLYAAENDGIYGDSFTVEQKAVTGIGNNVSIIFNDMDFGVNGAGGVTISSRSRKEKNSVKFVFTDDNGYETAVMAEITSSGDYKTQDITFTKPVTGNIAVSLIFLPGCDIDLQWIRFIR